MSTPNCSRAAAMERQTSTARARWSRAKPRKLIARLQGLFRLMACCPFRSISPSLFHSASPRAGSSALRSEWNAFASALRHFERQTRQVKTSFAFWFAEGSLVKALKEGHWLLLDEINLVR